MKQIVVALSTIFSLFFLFSCEKNSISDINEKKPMNFQFGFAETRVDIETPAFTDGDQIGVYVVKRKRGSGVSELNDKDKICYNNVRLIYNFPGNSKSWVPDEPMDFPDLESDEVLDIYAYHPYQAGIDPTNMQFSVKSDQYSDKKIGESLAMTAYVHDVNYADIESQKDGAVHLYFIKQVAWLDLVCKMKARNVPLEEMAIMLRTRSDVFDLAKVARELTSVNATTETITTGSGMRKIKEVTESDYITYYYRVLVLPQTIDFKKDNEMLQCIWGDQTLTRIKITTEKEQMTLEKGLKYELHFTE